LAAWLALARHVQIGQIASPTLTLPAPLVRSIALNLMGFAVFYAPLEVRRAAYLRVTELAARGGLTVHLEVLPLAEISTAWHCQRKGNGTKLVIGVRSALVTENQWVGLIISASGFMMGLVAGIGLRYARGRMPAGRRCWDL
jgi:hypothetical protein